MPVPQYKTTSIILENKGLNARYTQDRMPPYTYINHDNAECRQENSIASRLGRTAITTDGSTQNFPLSVSGHTNVHTLARLAGQTDFRYAGCYTAIFRRTGDTVGAYTNITGTNFVGSGNRFASSVYRPSNSANPYIFFSDFMLKDNGEPLTTTGVVNTSTVGNTVTWVSGSQFQVGNSWIGLLINIGGNLSIIESVPSPTTMTVDHLAGTFSSIGYTVTQTPLIWGIFPPITPALMNLLAFSVIPIDDFESSAGTYTVSGFTGSVSQVNLVNTTSGTAITAGTQATATPASMTNIVPYSQLTVDTGGSKEDVVVISITATTFTAFFTNAHTGTWQIVNHALQGVITTPGTATVSLTTPLNLSVFPGGGLVSGSDLVNLGLLPTFTGGATTVTVKITFTVPGGSYTATAIEFIGGGGYQEFSFPISSFVTAGSAGLPGSTLANVTAWTISLTVPTGGASTITFDINDFYLFGGSGPDVTGNGIAYDYRYTFYDINTGDESGPSPINLVGGGPSGTPLAGFSPAPVSPVRQPVQVNMGYYDSTFYNPNGVIPFENITHFRLYRRGGTLPDQWLQVAQVPAFSLNLGTFTPHVGATVIDNLSDEQIAANNILDTDTFPPITSNLANPVNTTTTSAISPGYQAIPVASTFNVFVGQQVTLDAFTPSQEIVVVSIVGPGNQFFAFAQLSHASGASVTASTRIGQPVYISTIAFDRAWVAGDPNNPNILYWSDRFNPESFTVEGFVEIGVPSDPIVAVVEWNGQLYVLTQNLVYNILGAQSGGITEVLDGGQFTPVPYKTAAKHGLAAPFGWCVTEGEIWYVSFGGIYAFNGSASQYVSEPIEWIFTDQFIDDDVTRPVVPMDPTQISQTLMAYYQNEIYVSYMGTDAKYHRVIWSQVYKRWRNDDAPTNATMVEDDIYTLIYGDTAGMIYQDRVGNFDSAGWVASVQQFNAFTYNLQTAFTDLGMPKNYKNFNEFTLDIDTGGLTVAVALVFDLGDTTTVSLGTVNTGSSGRGQVDFKINAGIGQLAINVSMLLTVTINSAITNPVTVYEAHIRATPEAELRQSFDSYFLDFGTPDYKILKQFWLEFFALDPAGITFSIYLGGSSTPSYSFTVPQALTRTSKRVRVPAMKARIWRLVATSNSDFRLYSDSRYEAKHITMDKSYEIIPLQQEEPTQP